MAGRSGPRSWGRPAVAVCANSLPRVQGRCYGSGMQVRELIQDGLHIVQIAGEVDMAASPELREVLGAHADAKRDALLIDFTEVKYVDSSGLATLVEYVQKSARYGGRFAVGGLSENVQTIFEMVRLHEVFPVHASVSDARSALVASGV